MKKFKIALWLILIILLILVFFQNKAFMLGKQALILNLFIGEEMQSPPLPIGVWLLVALCVGFLFAFFLALIEKFKTGRMIKAMKAQINNQTEMIAQLKNEFGSRGGFQSNDVVDAQPIADIGGPTSVDK